MVVCLEDAIADERVADGEDNLVEALLRQLHAATVQDELPLLFVRVRERRSRSRRSSGGSASAAHVLDGFVLPKFTAAQRHRATCSRSTTAEREAGTYAAGHAGDRVAARCCYAETRVDELTRLRALLHRDRRRILAVRIGATDLCALYGLRRSPELVDLRHQGRRRAHRRRRQRARPYRRHRVHGVRAGVGVLRRPRADLQAAAAPVAVPPARRPHAARRAGRPAPSTG